MNPLPANQPFTTLVAALTGLLFLAAPLWANTDETLDEVQRLLEKDDTGIALEKLLAMEEHRAGEPAFDLLLGRAFFKTGDWSRAQFSFERVLIVEESNRTARLAMATLFMHRQATDLVERELAILSRQELTPGERREMAALEEWLLRQRPSSGGEQRTRINGFVQLSLGHDSNVTYGPDADSLLIPGYSTTTVTSLGDASEDDDALALLSAGVTFRRPLANDAGFQGGISLSHNLHRQRNDVDEGYGNLHLGLYRNVGKHVFTLTALGQLYGVDDTIYRHHWGAQINWQHPTAASNGWWNGYVHFLRYTYPDDPEDNADRVAGGLTLSQAVGPKKNPTRFQFGLYGGLEEERSAGYDFVGYHFTGGTWEMIHPLSTDLDLLAGIGVEGRRHNSDENLYYETRRDIQSSFNLSLDYGFAENWHFIPSIHYTRNDSNLDLYEYDRLVAGVTSKWEFGQ